MQHHNLYLNMTGKLLTQSGVEVYTVKTDAFRIRSSKLKDAEELLNWESGIGSWRFSRSDDIKHPTEGHILALRDSRLIQRSTKQNPSPLRTSTTWTRSADTSCNDGGWWFGRSLRAVASPLPVSRWRNGGTRCSLFAP
jgi:hypothetical protein